LSHREHKTSKMDSLRRCALVLCVATLGLARPPRAVGDMVSEVNDGFEARRLNALWHAVEKPFPGLGTQWGDLVYAIAALWLNENVDAANEMLASMGPRPDGAPRKYGPMDHWRLQQAHRLLLLYGSDAQLFPGRLSPAAEAALLWHTWEFVKSRSRLADADPERTWWLVGSENHDIMYKTTYLFGALVLSRAAQYAERTYDAGGTPAQHYAAWLRYFERYLDERARNGLFIEVASPTYQKYTLGSIYNLHDLATQEPLRRKAKMLLHLVWADWAEDQIDGVRGGGKSRVYQGNYSRRGAQDGMFGYQYPYFGFEPIAVNPGSIFALTSSYRVPDVVLDIGLDRVGRGAYETMSRRPGDPGDEETPEGTYSARPRGRILRYGYHTPEYVLGCCMIDPSVQYTGISAQNRWQGAIFRGHPDARVFAYRGSTRTDKPQTYDAFIAVQYRNVMMLCPNPDRHKYNLEAYVHFAPCLDERIEENGSVFVRHAKAYLRVTVSSPDWEWVDGNTMKVNDRRAAIVFHCGRERDADATLDIRPSTARIREAEQYRSFAEFRETVRWMELSMDGSWLTYPARQHVPMLMARADGSQVPMVYGRPVELMPTKVFDTPFIEQEWGAGKVTIRKDERGLVLDLGE